MRRWLGPLLLVALLASLGEATSPAGACACGVAIEATVTEERALVVETPEEERLILSLDLATDSGSGRAAVVLPVPSEPSVAAIERGDPLSYLDRATALPPGTTAQAGGGETAGAAVDVIARETVGGYDVSRLRAEDSEALSSWLDANGYTLPAGAEPILAEYIDEGWAFVAIRLAPETEGRLKPLQVSFETARPVYPMRLDQLSTSPVSLRLYALADSERAVDGLETTWSGPVGDLAPPPPEGLESLFAQGEYVTRMEAVAADPATFTSDLELVSEDTGAPAATVPTPESDDGGLSALAIIGLCVACLALAGLLFRIAR
jgi:hypothetical protein